MKPEISIITTVYNCENYVFDSIQSILNQTFTNFEYIIVNDGSTDGTQKIIQRLALTDERIIFIDNRSNLGRVRSLNMGIEISKGNLIAIQDADDISLPQRIEKQYLFLKENPDFVLVGSDISVSDEKGKIISNPIRPETNLEAKFSLLFRCTFANPSIMYRKDIVMEFGIRYDENFLHAEDFKFISLISRHGKVFNLKDKLIIYRKHDRNNSEINSEALNASSTAIVKENLHEIGYSVEEDQIKRIRNLISSRGIDRNFLLEDVKLIFNIIKKFQIMNNSSVNIEILKTLKRMTKWLGKKNILTKPGYFALQISILNYYNKQVKFNKQKI